MMCREVQYEDEDKDVVGYGDQGMSTEEYEKATYGTLTKTQSEEEEEVKYNVALCEMTVCHWEIRGDLMKQQPTNTYMMFVRLILH